MEMTPPVRIEDAMVITGHSDRKIFLHYAKKRDERAAAERVAAQYDATYAAKRQA
jgi:hypothetical protein